METRANAFFVTVVVALLTGLLLVFLVWLYSGQEPRGAAYEIQFRRSVAGLRTGSAVTLSGVKVGTVEKIEIDAADPGVVRVSIKVEDDAPLGVGVTASLNTSLLGDATISLEGATRDAPPLRSEGRGAVPVIPVAGKPLFGGGGGIVSVFEQVSKTTVAVNDRLDDQGRARIERALKAAERDTSRWAKAAPVWADNLPALKGDVRRARSSLIEYEAEAANLDSRLQAMTIDGPDSLRAKLRRIQASSARVEEAMREVRSKVAPLSQKQTDAVDQIKKVRQTVRDVRDRVEQIDHSGIRPMKLPDYREHR